MGATPAGRHFRGWALVSRALEGAAPPPGVLVVSRAGDLATGNPKYSANFTSTYTFGSGWLKGVRLTR